MEKMIARSVQSWESVALQYDRCAVWCGNVQTALPASQMQEMDVTAEITAIVKKEKINEQESN